MPDKQPLKRYLEGSRVFYDVLSSHGPHYYTVEMLGLVALSCECTGNAEFKKHCKHMQKAEKAERIFQQSAEIPSDNFNERSDGLVKSETVKGNLNGDRAFFILKK